MPVFALKKEGISFAPDITMKTPSPKTRWKISGLASLSIGLGLSFLVASFFQSENRCPASSDFCKKGSEAFLKSGAVFDLTALKRNFGYEAENADPPDYGLRFAAEFSANEKVAIKAGQNYPFGVQLVEIGSSADSTVAIHANITRHFVDESGQSAYIAFDNQAVELLEKSADGLLRPLRGQGKKQHPGGYSTPVGVPLGFSKPIEQHSLEELESLHGIVPGKDLVLEYPSGVKVTGKLAKIQTNSSGVPVLFKFENKSARVKFGVHTLFAPSWGEYDMLLGAIVTDSRAAPSSWD